MEGMPHVTGWDGFLAGVYFFFCVVGFLYGVSLTIKAHKEPVYIKELVHVPAKKKSNDNTSFCDDDWNTICRSAIEGAKAGNHRDRQWVVENVLDSPEAKEDDEKLKTTSKTIINEVIATLRSMGHKASEAKKLVMDLASKKVYHSAEELLVDVYKR